MKNVQVYHCYIFIFINLERMPSVFLNYYVPPQYVINGRLLWKKQSLLQSLHMNFVWFVLFLDRK